MSTKKEQRIEEGLCPECGKLAFPYYYCQSCRHYRNVARTTKSLAKKGVLKEKRDDDGQLMYEAVEGDTVSTVKEAIMQRKTNEKMQLPRLNHKPMTEDVLGDAVVDILNENGVPMSEKEIEEAVKKLKTAHKIIPIREDLIKEYGLIKNKKSRLSKTQRDAVEYRVSFLKRKGVSLKPTSPT